jgi:hypothetical protein
MKTETRCPKGPKPTRRTRSGRKPRAAGMTPALWRQFAAEICSDDSNLRTMRA